MRPKVAIIAIIVRSKVAIIAIIVRSEVAIIAIIVSPIKYLGLQYIDHNIPASEVSLGVVSPTLVSRSCP